MLRVAPQHDLLQWATEMRRYFSRSSGGLTGFGTVALIVVVASRGCRYGAAAMAARSCASVGFCPVASPSLFGVVGRKAGSVPGFRYSPANQKSGETWDAATLD